MTALTRLEPDLRSRSVSCIGFKPFRSGTLVGFGDFHVPTYKLKILGCSVHQHETGRRWVSLPAKVQLDHDKRPLLDSRGKVQYAPTIAFDSDQIRIAFSEAAIAALLAYQPDAFGRGCAP